MKRNLPCLYIVMISILLASCQARFYTPNRNPIPLFRQKGDLFADGSVSLAADKYDLTGGYAFTNWLAGYAGYGGAYTAGSLDSGKYTKYKYKGNMLNVGAGVFVPSTVINNVRLEVFADYAKGNFMNSATGDLKQYFNGNFQRIGVMPNIGVSIGNFSIAYSLRVSQLTFSNAVHSESDSGFWAKDIKRLNSKGSYMIMEQALQFRLGFEHIKFQLQLGAFNTNADESVNAVPRFRGSVMVGVVLNANILGKD